jgi:hypothetical protein
MRRLLCPALILAAPALAAGPQEFTLATGLRCLLLENHERPLVRLELVTRWDPKAEAGMPGRIGFLVDLLAHAGAGPHSRAGFQRALDDQGIDFGFEGGLERLRWTVVADSRSQEAAFELLADAVFRPSFDGPQVEGRRQALIRQDAALSMRERTVAAFLASLGQGRITLPPGADLVRFGYQELQTLQVALVQPGASVLAIYGDLSLAQARELALLHFGVWGRPGAEAAKAAPGPNAGPGARPLVALLEGGTRAELWAGGRAPVQARPALDELLAILLETLPVAEDAVAVRCQLAPGGTDPILLKVEAAEPGREALVPALVALLERLRRHGFTQVELDLARLRWQAERAAQSLHPKALLSRTLQGRLEPGLEGAVAAASLAEVNARLALWLDPAGLRCLLLGADAALLQAALKAGLGPAELVQPGL